MTGRARLTDALALAARPHEREYAVHDTCPSYKLRPAQKPRPFRVI